MPQDSGRRLRQEAWFSLISLLVRPCWAGFLHRIECDGAKMGFRPLRDNQVLRHRIFAQIAGNTVPPVIDAPVARLACAHALTGSFAPSSTRVLVGRDTSRSAETTKGHGLTEVPRHAA